MVSARFQSPNLNLGCVHPYKVEGIIQIIQPVAEKVLDVKLTAYRQPSLCWLKSRCQFGITKAFPDSWVQILPLLLWQVKDGHKFFDTLLMERWGLCHSPSESEMTLWQLWLQRYKSDHVPVSGPGLRKCSFHFLSLWALTHHAKSNYTAAETTRRAKTMGGERGWLSHILQLSHQRMWVKLSWILWTSAVWLLAEQEQTVQITAGWVRRTTRVSLPNFWPTKSWYVIKWLLFEIQSF